MGQTNGRGWKKGGDGSQANCPMAGHVINPGGIMVTLPSTQRSKSNNHRAQVHVHVASVISQKSQLYNIIRVVGAIPVRESASSPQNNERQPRNHTNFKKDGQKNNKPTKTNDNDEKP